MTIKKYTMRVILLFALLLLYCGCSTTRYIPVNSTTTVTIKDTVTLIDTLVLVDPPKETTSVLSLLNDTSVVSTSLATSTAYIDSSTLTLKHTITNNNDPIPVKVQYKDHLVVKDSVVIKEVPVKVPEIKEVVPGWAYKVLIYSILLTFLVVGYVYIKLKKRGF